MMIAMQQNEEIINRLNAAAEKSGDTALRLAVDVNRKDLVAEILRRGANPNTPDIFGDTPLSWAAYRGNEEMIQQLIAAGSNVNTQDKRGWTPLMLAVANDYPAIVRLLLQNGARMDLENLEGETAEEIFHSSEIQKIFDTYKKQKGQGNSH